MVTLHVFPEAESQPLQLVNVEAPSGVAVNVTAVPSLKLAEQVGPQLIPAGALVTVPLPVPVSSTIKFRVTAVNVAVTDRAAAMETVHVLPEVESQPLQFAKVEPLAAFAVSVTEAPLLKEAEQVPGQLMPPLELVTVPLPLPASATDRVKLGPFAGANAIPRKAVFVAAWAMLVSVPLFVAL